MKKIIIYTVFFIFSFLNVALAETTVKAQVDKTTLTTDETLSYKLTITSSEKKIGLPSLPKFTGFDLVSQMQSSSMSVAAEGIQTSLSYVFILVPLDAGKFTIEPGSVNIKGKTYTTDSFQIEVKQGKTPPRSKAEPKNIPPDIESEEPQTTL